MGLFLQASVFTLMFPYSVPIHNESLAQMCAVSFDHEFNGWLTSNAVVLDKFESVTRPVKIKNVEGGFRIFPTPGR